MRRGVAAARAALTPRSADPVLDAQARDALELAGVVAYQRRIEREGVAGGALRGARVKEEEES